MLQAEHKKYQVSPLGLRHKDWQIKGKTLLLAAENFKTGLKLLVKAKAKQEKPADRTGEQLR